MLMELLNVESVVHPQDSKTNRSHSFSVEQPLEKITLFFSYTPKELTDGNAAQACIEQGMERYAPGEFRAGYDSWESYLPLVNLITLSLDDPNGYRGCAHRHTPEQRHTISRREASPGFEPGMLPMGEWNAVINLHAVVTDECTYSLRIVGERGEAQ